MLRKLSEFYPTSKKLTSTVNKIIATVNKITLTVNKIILTVNKIIPTGKNDSNWWNTHLLIDLAINQTPKFCNFSPLKIVSSANGISLFVELPKL